MSGEAIDTANKTQVVKEWETIKLLKILRQTTEESKEEAKKLRYFLTRAVAKDDLEAAPLIEMPCFIISLFTITAHL